MNRRKLSKLRNNPRKFFRDAVHKRSAPVADALRSIVPGLRYKCRHRFSVVSAVYNVSAYLDDFFGSMESQSITLGDDLELIMVDDGSTDDSAAIIERWQSRFPGNIRYVHKENGGQASARNVGLEYVTGQWVTFIDPDDFVDAQYFERVDELLARHEADDVGLVCCKWIFFHEKNGRYADNHPLSYRFANGSFVTRQNERADFMASSAATSFYRADVLARSELRFDEQLRPNFEDGHFSGRYLLQIPDAGVGFVADAHYYYRKRADASSTLDSSWADPRRFDDVVRRGYLGLLEEAVALRGEVPRSVQRLVLYDIFWYFRRMIDNEESVSFLTAEQKQQFFELLLQVFRYIDDTTILNFAVAGCWFYHRIGLLGQMKGLPAPYQVIYLRDYDPTRRLVHLAYFHHGDDPVEEFVVDGREVVPVFAKTREHRFLDSVFVNERLIWLQLEAGAMHVDAKIAGGDTRVRLGSTQYPEGLEVEQIAATFDGLHQRKKRPGRARVLAALAKSAPVASYFADAWMLIDRDSQADDNAEHLYRYIAAQHREINAFFVLRESSHDWARLRDEGFRLVAYGSLQHKLLMLNARHVISSHPDSFVLHFLPPKLFGGLLDFKFTFLQHGVIRDDISRWLNRKKIDLFITSSPREHESVAGDRGAYKFGALATKMTGLARHDALLARTEPTEKVILIMPTWRQWLVGTTSRESTERDQEPAFFDSDYARGWRDLIHSPELRDLVAEHGYRVVFFPHANMQLYCDWFDAPSWVDVRTHATEPILHKLFRRAAVMITDYSSVFFEMGLLDKPVIYYQFDFEEMYGGEHPSRLGYFDFQRDGFGPVAFDQAALLRELEAILQRGAVPNDEYLRRMRETLPRRDGLNRMRTVQAIKDLDSPVLRDEQSATIAVAQARAATRAEMWELAEARWARICEEAGDDGPADRVERLAEARAKRHDTTGAPRAASR